MKILVLSDSHRRDDLLTSIIEQHMDSDAIVFLGDGINDFETALDRLHLSPDGEGDSKVIVSVLGNWDAYGRTGENKTVTFGGINFYITHGAQENIRMGYWGLVDAAKDQKCQVALFGHSHIQVDLVKDGIRLINPGAVKEHRYGIVNIDDESGEISFERKTI